MNKINVAAYCRVSTNSIDQVNSFENQQLYFIDRANQKKDEKLVKIYADKGITGTSIKKRDEFKQMIYDAGINEYKGNKKFTYEADPSREPKFSKIYVRNTSRFTRDVAIIDILRELLKKKVHVHFLDIDLIFDGEDKEFTLNLFLNFSQQESVDKSKKVKDGNSVSALKGVIRVGGKGLYGYDYHSDTKTLSIIEEEAETIRKIFELYINGYGIRRIINYLHDNNYYPRNKGEYFPINTIKNILSNEKYYGNNVRNKYSAGSVFNKTTAKLNPRNEQIDHEDKIPAIIDKETFFKAQSIKKEKPHHISQKGVYKGISEYASLIICDKCGKAYVSNVDRGRHFYNCSTKKSKGSVICNAPNISKSILNEAIEYFAQEDGIKNTIINIRQNYIDNLNQITQLLEGKIDNQKQNDADSIGDEIRELNEQKYRLIKLYMSGKFDEMTLDKMSTELDKEIVEKQNIFRELTLSNEEIIIETNEIKQTINDLMSMDIKSTYTRQEAINQISKITVCEAESETEEKMVLLIFEFKVFEVLNKIVSKYQEMDKFNTHEGVSIRVK